MFQVRISTRGTQKFDRWCIGHNPSRRWNKSDTDFESTCRSLCETKPLIPNLRPLGSRNAPEPSGRLRSRRNRCDILKSKSKVNFLYIPPFYLREQVKEWQVLFFFLILIQQMLTSILRLRMLKVFKAKLFVYFHQFIYFSQKSHLEAFNTQSKDV